MIGRLGSLIALAISQFGCGAIANGSYPLDRGVASYDGLKAATVTCEAKGGALRLRKGYQGQDLSDYDCALARTR